MMDPSQLQRLVTVSMPYGKYKGRLLADLPGNYLNWFAREGFPRSDLGRLLALMHEIDHNGLSQLLEPLRSAAGLPRARRMTEARPKPFEDRAQNTGLRLWRRNFE
jgi:hypothetical protein